MLSFKMLMQGCLQLKPTQRFLILEALMKSLDKPDPEIEKKWAEEAEKRLKAYKAGKLATISLNEMFQ